MFSVIRKMGIVEQWVGNIGETKLGIISIIDFIGQGIGDFGQIVLAIVKVSCAVWPGTGNPDGMVLAIEFFCDLMSQRIFLRKFPPLFLRSMRQYRITEALTLLLLLGRSTQGILPLRQGYHAGYM